MAGETASGVAPIEARVAAVEAALREAGHDPADYIEAFIHTVEEEWVPRNGARIVAQAWTDPAFKERLMGDGRSAVFEMGFTMPAHHKYLVVLENTDAVHNVIVCTQCSCTAMSIIGLPPGWYKDFDYRARVVRESRTVLREMGLDLPEGVEIRVWDTSADTRYMVLPARPAGTDGWSEDALAALVTKDAMIGVARVDLTKGEEQG